MTRFAAKTFFATVLVFLLCSVSLAQTPANTTVYIYDELGRLKAVITPSGDTAIYSYDAAGNITSITRQSSNDVSVIEFTPDQGAVGTAVTIFGTGFSLVAAENTVQFNGVAATVTSASHTRLIAVVPAGATTGPITVTTPSGSAASTTNFQVLQDLAITGFSPTIGAPGTAVQINGTNFDPAPANNQLKFNIATASVTAATSSTLNTTVPANATSGRISLTTPAGSASTTADFFVPPSPYTAASVDFAGRIAFGETRTFSVNAANRIALLVFDATAGQRVSLQAANSTISISTISVIQPDGSNLLNPTARSGNWFIDPLTLPVTGTYTIVIDPNSTFTGIMSLTLHNVPPDVSGTLIPSGPSVSINITGPGQNANLSFAGTAGQRVSLSLTDVSISSSTVSIRRANGTTLVSSSVTPPGVVFGTLVLPATETYSVVVDPTDLVTGVMTLSLAEVPENATGTIIIGGPHVVVTIAAPGQAAQLTFTATEGQIVELDHPGTVPLSGSSLTISKPDGTLLQDTYGLSNSDHIVRIPVTGTYTININPSGTSTGSINFALYEVPQPATATMTVGGPPLSLTIPAAGQIGKVTFQGTAGERVSLNVSNTKVGPFGLYVEITAPDGSFVGFTFADPPVFYDDDYFDFYNFVDTMVLPATGTYTITIYPDFDTSGSMDLRLYTVPPDITGTITPGGPPVTVTTTAPGQDARLTFNGAAGQRVSLKVNSVFPFAPYNCLLGPGGTVVEGTACSESFRGRTAFVDTVTLPFAGTYTVRINGIYAGTGTATVSLYDVPPNLTGTLTIGGPPVTVTATAAGQDAEMPFTGTAGQRISLKVSGTLPEFSNVDILTPTNQPLNPFGRTIKQLGSVRAEIIETLVLPVTGTYKVRINTWNDSGTMTFNLYEVPPDVNDGTISVGGPPVTLTSTAERQNRRLTFAGTAGQVINLKVNNGTSLLNQVWIYRPDGIRFTGKRADAAAMSVATDLGPLPVTGTYSIVAELFALGDAVTLTLGSGPPDATGTVTLDGQPTTITVPAANQRAVYSFNSTAGQRVAMRMSDVTMREANVSITGQELECCLQNFVANQGRGTERFSVRKITTTGPNAVVVDPFSDYTGSVTTRLWDVPADVTSAVTINGPPVTVTTTTPGQNATLTFNGATGQQVTIHVTNNTVGAVTIEFLRPTGAFHTVYLTSGGTFDLPVQSLPTPGAYQIVINPDRANTGSVTVSVTSP